MLEDLYQAVKAAWVEGRLENVLQRQKELAALHSNIQKHRTTLISGLCKDLSITEASASEEVGLSLETVTKLYDNLDFPSTLVREKAIKTGRRHSNGLTPLGPTLIQASPSCPLSSVVLPLAAAISAGSCCLVLCANIPLSLEIDKLIRTSLDQEAVGVFSQDYPIGAEELGKFYFGVAVLQDCTTETKVATALRRTNPAIRIHAVSAGLPAVFVDRSSADVDAVAGWIVQTILLNPRENPGRVPRLCFADEFIIDKLAERIEGSLHSKPLPEPRQNQINSQNMVDLLLQTFPFLDQNSLLRGSSKLPALVMLPSSDSVSPTVLTQVARLITTHYPGILLIPVRSLDHGIDMWNKVNDGATAQTTYIFGAGGEASYMSQFLASEHFFVNHIPLRSFVMVAPTSHQDSYELPFRPEDFSCSKCIFQEPLRHPDIVSSSKKTRRYYLNLKKISQPVGGHVSYFEQGLVVGLGVAGVTACSLIYFLLRGLKLYSHR